MEGSIIGESEEVISNKVTCFVVQLKLKEYNLVIFNRIHIVNYVLYIVSRAINRRIFH